MSSKTFKSPDGKPLFEWTEVQDSILITFEPDFAQFEEACKQLSQRLQELGPLFSDVLKSVMQKLEDEMIRGVTMPRVPSAEAELIVRLEEIMERESEGLELIHPQIVGLQEDIKALAYGLLVLLRREETPIFRNKHVYDSRFTCMLCGISRAEVEASGLQACMGGGV